MWGEGRSEEVKRKEEREHGGKEKRREKRERTSKTT